MTFCPTDTTRDILLQRFSYIVSYLIRLQIIAHKNHLVKVSDLNKIIQYCVA